MLYFDMLYVVCPCLLDADWCLRSDVVTDPRPVVRHHDDHHLRLRGNFSLYFPLWDRLLGTEIVRKPECGADSR